MRRTALFFDFDNTLTEYDVLDEIIETFSVDGRWREWETAYVEGRMSARDCLTRQIENLRVTREELLGHLSTVRIDPLFGEILAWAQRHRVPVKILSDSFEPLIRHLLRSNAVEGVPVIANGLEFDGERLIPSFPHYDPACTRSANAKARHLSGLERWTVVFAGDGRSDLDAALGADVVFAKAALANELRARSVPFQPFDTLVPVLSFLEQTASTGYFAGARRSR